MKFPSVVSDVMNEIISIDAETFVYEAAQKMMDHRIGSIIVTENGEPKGIITRSDMIKRIIVAYNDPRITKSGSVISSPLITVEADKPILEVMRYIRDKNVNQILVEKDGKLAGIVSEGDLVRAVTLSSLAQFSSLLRKQ